MMYYLKLAGIGFAVIMLSSIAHAQSSENSSNIEITHIRTDPYYDKYLYTFKIQVLDKPLDEYKIKLTSDIDSKLVDSRGGIEPGSYVIWGIYIHVDDPRTIKVEILQ